MRFTVVFAAVLCTLALAAGQSCPKTICGSDGTYNATVCCQPGAVSSTKTGPCQPRPGLGVIELYNPNTCTQDGKRYIFWVDVRRGDVWDPMRKPLYCRCPSPTNVTVTSPLAKATSNTDIKGNDIACNKQQYCKVCGGVSAVQNACVQNAVCLAFTYEAASKCGYLKSVRGPLVKRPGWTTFITTFTN